MTAIELFTTLTTAGCRLLPDGERLRVQDPQHALTDDVRQAIRQHKAELLTLLAQPAPAHDAPATEPSTHQEHFPPPTPTKRATPFWERPGACYACGTTRSWRSVSGAVVCGTCHPPVSPELVAKWGEEEK